MRRSSAAVDTYFERLKTFLFSEEIKKLEHSWTKCVEPRRKVEKNFLENK